MKKSLFLSFTFILTMISSSIFGYSAEIAKKNHWLHSNNTELSAHRGARIAAPENTLESIKKAGDLGYGFIEIDVQQTKDKQYILMHDKKINRTTTGTGYVKDMTLDEIQRLSIKDKEGNITDYKVPTLQEALAEAHKYKLGVNFDGSKGNWNDHEFVKGIIKEAKKAKVFNHSFFVLSNTETRDQFNAWYPEATVTFLGNALANAEADIEELKKYQNALYTVSIDKIDTKTAEKIRNAGLKLHIYSVNTPEAYEKAKHLYPRLIETDVITPRPNKY